jgi:hypothetical protein
MLGPTNPLYDTTRHQTCSRHRRRADRMRSLLPNQCGASGPAFSASPTHCRCSRGNFPDIGVTPQRRPALLVLPRQRHELVPSRFSRLRSSLSQNQSAKALHARDHFGPKRGLPSQNYSWQDHRANPRLQIKEPKREFGLAVVRPPNPGRLFLRLRQQIAGQHNR